MIDIVYKLVLQLMAKHITGGYLSPDEFNRYALVAQNQKIDDDLRKARETRNMEMISSFVVSEYSLPVFNGIANKPSDFRRFESAYYTDFSSGNPYVCAVEELDNDEFNWRLGSELDNPSLDYPAIVVRDTTIQVAPREIDFLKLTYVKYVPNPTWAYVTPVVSRFVYDPISSVQFTYGADDIPDLVYRITKLAGVEIGDDSLYQITTREQQITD